MLRHWWPTPTNFSRKLASLTIVWHLHLFWLLASLVFLNLGIVVPHSMLSQLTTCPPRMCVANVFVSVPLVARITWWKITVIHIDLLDCIPQYSKTCSCKLHPNQCEVLSTKLVDSMGRRTLLLSGGFVQTIAMASWLQAAIDQTGSKSPDLSWAMSVVSQVFLGSQRRSKNSQQFRRSLHSCARFPTLRLRWSMLSVFCSPALTLQWSHGERS